MKWKKGQKEKLIRYPATLSLALTRAAWLARQTQQEYILQALAMRLQTEPDKEVSDLVFQYMMNVEARQEEKVASEKQALRGVFGEEEEGNNA